MISCFPLAALFDTGDGLLFLGDVALFFTPSFFFGDAHVIFLDDPTFLFADALGVLLDGSPFFFFGDAFFFFELLSAMTPVHIYK